MATEPVFVLSGCSGARPGRIFGSAMKRVLLVLFVVPLLMAATVEAKGLKWVKVCGPSGCSKTDGHELGGPIIFPPKVMHGGPHPPPTEPAPWLRVRVAFGHHRATSVVAPSIRYAGGRDGSYGFIWERLRRAEWRTYKRLARGVERFPAATLPGL